MWKKTILLFVACISLCLSACGGAEDKVYGLWLNEDRSLVQYGHGVSFSAFELTSNTYRHHLLSRPQEMAIYYEVSEGQVIVREAGSKEAVLILRDIKGDSLTVLAGSPKPYNRVNAARVEEVRKKIEESSRRR